MTNEQWAKIKHFKPQGGLDQFGDPGLMDAHLVTMLDQFREYIGRPCLVTSGTQGIHSLNSLHYSGRAIDFVVDCGDRSRFDVFLELSRFPFTGIGVYPDWKWEGRARVIGFHVDNRAITYTDGRVQARWLRAFDRDEGKMVDHSVCESILNCYGVI